MITPRNRDFVEYYLSVAAGNATEAARLAGYKDAESAATKLLGSTEVRALIDSQLGKVGASIPSLLSALADIAFADIGDMMDATGPESVTFNLPRAKKLRQTRRIKKIKLRRFTKEDRQGLLTTTEEVDIEMYSRLDAIEKLGRYHGMWKDKVDITTNGESITTVVYMPDNGRDPQLAHDATASLEAPAGTGAVPVEPG